MATIPDRVEESIQAATECTQISGLERPVLADLLLDVEQELLGALSIRFEALNALNHPNWGTPNMNLSSATFGRIT